MCGDALAEVDPTVARDRRSVGGVITDAWQIVDEHGRLRAGAVEIEAHDPTAFELTTLRDEQRAIVIRDAGPGRTIARRELARFAAGLEREQARLGEHLAVRVARL